MTATAQHTAALKNHSGTAGTSGRGGAGAGIGAGAGAVGVWGPQGCALSDAELLAPGQGLGGGAGSKRRRSSVKGGAGAAGGGEPVAGSWYTVNGVRVRSGSEGALRVLLSELVVEQTAGGCDASIYSQHMLSRENLNVIILPRSPCLDYACNDEGPG